VVTHGGILDSIFRHVVGLALGAPRHHALPNAARNVFVHDGKAWSLVTWGDVRHLAGLTSGSRYEF